MTRIGSTLTSSAHAASVLGFALVIVIVAEGTTTADDRRGPPRGHERVATSAIALDELEVPLEPTDVQLEAGVPMDVLHPALAAWIHPIADSDELVPTRSQRKFNARREGSNAHRYGCRRNRHCGIDLSGPRGRTIVAVTEGVVVHIERRRNGKDGKSGRYVRIEHAGGVFTSYMHLDAIAPGLSIGDQVEAGQFIGRLGRSGIKRSEPHLHFNLELEVGKNATKMLDSTPYLNRATVIEDPAPKRENNLNKS